PHLGGNGFHGIAWEKSGQKVWTTDAYGTLHGASRRQGSTFAWSNRIQLHGPGGAKDPSAPGGIALDEARQLLYVTLSRKNSLGIVNLATGSLEAEIPVGIAPYEVLLQGERAFVTNWGGRQPVDVDFTGPTSGSEAV